MARVRNWALTASLMLSVVGCGGTTGTVTTAQARRPTKPLIVAPACNRAMDTWYAYREAQPDFVLQRAIDASLRSCTRAQWEAAVTARRPGEPTARHCALCGPNIDVRTLTYICARPEHTALLACSEIAVLPAREQVAG